jgi:hypothetical protein
MTGKADFTEAEWDLVREGPTTAGVITLLASSGGSFRESWALAKTFAEARQQQGQSPLLDALVDEKPDIERYGSAEEAEQKGLGRLREAVALLEQRATPDEVESYRRFTLEVAQRVSEAHKEGGEAVSPAEREAIAKIEATLGAEPGAPEPE